MKRQTAMALRARSYWPATHSQSAKDIPALLRSCACVFLIRDAETDPGIGDLPNFHPVLMLYKMNAVCD